MVVGGSVVYLARTRLAGPSALLAVLIPPVSFGLDFAVGWPTWNVMNTHASQLTMSLVSLLTLGLCAAELWLVSAAVKRRGHRWLNTDTANGEGGIRTLDGPNSPYRFSRPSRLALESSRFAGPSPSA